MEPNDPNPPAPTTAGDTPEWRSQPPKLPPPPPPARRGSPAHPAPENRRRTGTGWKIAAVLFALMLVVSVLFNFVALLFSGGSQSTYTTQSNLMEVVLEDNASRNKIAVLSLEGIISGQNYGANGYSLVSHLKHQLELCRDDARIKAVVLKVDSPGGEVLASDDIAKLIEDFQKESGKPIISSMGSLAASGGYYVSAPCQWIVANELTMTGSIGVIMSGYNLRGLMDKVGVRPMVFKSGDLKDMLSMSKKPEEVTDQEREIVQGIIQASFDRFKEVISEGRNAAADSNAGDGRELADDWENFADGRILTGRQAFEIGLVDELGNFDTAVERAQKLTGLANANLVTFQEPFHFGSLFRLLGESEARTVKLDLGVELPNLQAGKLYFLPPHLME